MNPMPPESPAHAKRDRAAWTFWQKAFAAALVLLGAAITAIAFRVIYDTVTQLARPYMRDAPWSVVISCEIAFLFLFGLGILLAWRKAPSPAQRGLFMALLIAGSVILNVWAARGNVPDMVVHLVVVCAFFAVLLSGKAAVTMLRGSKVRADRIALTEWMWHPVHSFRLMRWMATWGEASRAVAHARYMRLLYAVAVAQADPVVGKRPFGWRRNLPVTLRYQLSTGLLPQPAGEDWQESVTAHVRAQLHPSRPSPKVSPELPAEAALPEVSPSPSPKAITGGSPKPSPTPIQKVHKMGVRKATDEDIRDAIREMFSTGTPVTKYRVTKELKGPKGGISDERAGRLLAEVQAQRPNLHLAAAKMGS